MFKIIANGNNFFMAKKLLLMYIIISIILPVISILNINDFYKLRFDSNNGEIQYFCSGLENFENLDVQSVGYGSIVTCKINESKSIEKSLKGVQGISYKFNSDDFNVSKFLTNNSAEVVKIQKLNEICIIYAYSNKLEHLVNDDKMFNLEIAITRDKVVVGYPLIMGSY